MSKIKQKYIIFDTTTNGTNARLIPANYASPLAYTPTQVATEGTDKISAHLKGIDLTIRRTTVTSSSNTVLTLTTSSTEDQAFTGNTFGQRIELGDATTYSIGKQYRIINKTDTMLGILTNGTAFDLVHIDEVVKYHLIDNSTALGVWSVERYEIEGNNSFISWDDFIGSALVNGFGWTVNNTTGTTTVVADIFGAFGMIQLQIPTTISTRTCIYTGGGGALIRGQEVTMFECRFYLPSSLSSSTSFLRLGFATDETTNPATPISGAYIEINNNSRVLCKSTNASTTTTVDAGAAGPSTWHEITIVQKNNSVGFYLNNVLITTINTNLSTNTAVKPQIALVRGTTLGTGTNNVYIDWVKMQRRRGV